MIDNKDWDEEEIIPDDWTEEDIAWWNKFEPFLKVALFESAKEEVEYYDSLPDVEIEFSDDFKRGMNKIFRDAFGADCKIPHPEVENINKAVNV